MWRMHPKHDGMPLPANLAYPVPPSASIGEVTSADTNVPASGGAVGRFFRGLGGGSRCTYVGREGVQRWTQGSMGAPEEVVVRFSEVDRLALERARISRGGTYAGSVLAARFLRPPASRTSYTEGDDVPIAELRVEYHDRQGAAMPTNPDAQFILAAANAWNAWNVPRVLDTLARTGAATFLSTRGFMVRVERDVLSAGYLGKEMRTRAQREIAEIYFDNGRVLVEPPLGAHAEVAGGSLGNFSAFLAALKAAGYPVR